MRCDALLSFPFQMKKGENLGHEKEDEGRCAKNRERISVAKFYAVLYGYDHGMTI